MSDQNKAQNSAEVNDVPEQLRIRREKRERLLSEGTEAYPVTVERTLSLKDLRAPVSYTHLTLPTKA